MNFSDMGSGFNLNPRELSCLNPKDNENANAELTNLSSPLQIPERDDGLRLERNHHLNGIDSKLDLSVSSIPLNLYRDGDDMTYIDWKEGLRCQEHNKMVKYGCLTEKRLVCMLDVAICINGKHKLEKLDSIPKKALEKLQSLQHILSNLQDSENIKKYFKEAEEAANLSPSESNHQNFELYLSLREEVVTRCYKVELEKLVHRVQEAIKMLQESEVCDRTIEALTFSEESCHQEVQKLVKKHFRDESYLKCPAKSPGHFDRYIARLQFFQSLDVETLDKLLPQIDLNSSRNYFSLNLICNFELPVIESCDKLGDVAKEEETSNDTKIRYLEVIGISFVVDITIHKMICIHPIFKFNKYISETHAEENGEPWEAVLARFLAILKQNYNKVYLHVDSHSLIHATMFFAILSCCSKSEKKFHVRVIISPALKTDSAFPAFKRFTRFMSTYSRCDLEQKIESLRIEEFSITKTILEDESVRVGKSTRIGEVIQIEGVYCGSFWRSNVFRKELNCSRSYIRVNYRHFQGSNIYLAKLLGSNCHLNGHSNLNHNSVAHPDFGFYNYNQNNNTANETLSAGISRYTMGLEADKDFTLSASNSDELLCRKHKKKFKYVCLEDYNLICSECLEACLDSKHNVSNLYNNKEKLDKLYDDMYTIEIHTQTKRHLDQMKEFIKESPLLYKTLSLEYERITKELELEELNIKWIQKQAIEIILSNGLDKRTSQNGRLQNKEYDIPTDYFVEKGKIEASDLVILSPGQFLDCYNYYFLRKLQSFTDMLSSFVDRMSFVEEGQFIPNSQTLQNERPQFKDYFSPESFSGIKQKISALHQIREFLSYCNLLRSSLTNLSF